MGFMQQGKATKINAARHWAAALALAGAAWAGAGAAWAASIPFEGRQVEMTAREQPVASFLQDFFGAVDIPVAVSSGVSGAINGTFQGPADRVFNNILRSFGLMAYYDGSVVHVFTPSEISTRTFPLSSDNARTVIKTAQEMQLVDSRNTLRVGQGGSLIATGAKRFVEMVDELATGQKKQTDALAPLGFKVYYLRYAWAQDVTSQYGGKVVVIPGVASILRSLLTSQTQPQVLGMREQYLRPTVPGLRGRGMANQGTLGAEGASPMLASADTVRRAWGSGGGINVTFNETGNDLAPLVTLPGQARVEADARLNAIIVRDAPERLPYYDELIKSLDVEPQAVEIEATIIDLNTDRLRELGINWRWTDDRASFLFGNGTASDTLLHGTTATGNITPQGAGGFLSLVLGGRNQFVARINALQQQKAARVVSSPQIMTLSNVEALYDTTKSFYVKVQGRNEVDLFRVEAGTTLRVTPHVFKEGNDVRIKLLVQIEDGDFDFERSVDTMPTVNRSAINTQALIMAGESLLIGGMTREKSSEGVTKVPFLGDIPVLGNLFKTTERGGEHKERLFLISPRLVPARRALSGTAPVGPQRPGNAVQAPPMPELEPKPDTAQEKKDGAAAPKSRFLMPASGEASIGQTY